MAEISYMTQNGQKIYFKDAAGREMLAEKQPKLKAGKGISISNDGTISLAKAWKEVTTENVVTVDLGSGVYYDFKMTFAYLGNLSLLKNAKVLAIGCSTNTFDFAELFGGNDGGIPYDANSFFQLEDGNIILDSSYNFRAFVGSAIQQGLSNSNIVLEDTNEDFLYLMPKKISILEDNNITKTLDISMFIAFEFIENHTDNDTNEQYKLLNYCAFYRDEYSPIDYRQNDFGDYKIAERFFKRLVQSL